MLASETEHKQALKIRESLVYVGIVTRRRCLERCRRCKQGGIWIDVHGKADIELIEKGNKAGHWGLEEMQK